MDDVQRQIERTYESLSNPQYFSITRRLEERPYEELMGFVGDKFELVETTDENDEVAFTYALRREGRQWALEISAVGPYAVFARTDPVSQLWEEILTPSASDLSRDEHWLISKVSTSGLRFLGRQELEVPIPLQLVGTDPQYVRVYQALFTDSEILPWDRDTLHRLGLI
jgi:hypothetical protein